MILSAQGGRLNDVIFKTITKAHKTEFISTAILQHSQKGVNEVKCGFE